jgi:hypothetical protein
LIQERRRDLGGAFFQEAIASRPIEPGASLASLMAGQPGFHLHAQRRIAATGPIQERGALEGRFPLQRLPEAVLLPAAGRWFMRLHDSFGP